MNEIIQGYKIEYLGVRIVDPYRLHVGCGDYEINAFPEFKSIHLNKTTYVRDMGRDTEMLEFWHPDFDVLWYVIPKQS